MGVSVTVNNTARAASHAPAGELSDAARQAMDGATNMGVLNPGRLAEDLARRPAAERQQLLQELGPHLSLRDADSLTQELATRSTPAQGSEQSAGAACSHAPRSSPRLEQLEALKRETAGLDPDQLDAFVRFDETHAILDEAIQGIRVDTSGQYGWLEGGLRWAGDIGAQATRAVLGFGKDVALGLGQLVYEGGKLLVPGGSFHATLDAQILAEHIRLGNICLEDLKQAMQGMGQAAVKPVTDAWERGDYAEAVIRSGLEIGTLIAGVGAAAKAAGTAGKAAGAASAVVNSADEAARMAAAGRAAVAGADEAAKVAAGGTTGAANAVANSADDTARAAAASGADDVAKTSGTADEAASNVVNVAASRTVNRNGYIYHLDGNGRVMKVEGELKLNKNQSRNPSAQKNAGGSDRLPDDHGGHYIARIFDGPTDDFNHFAQNGNFNQGAYRALENSWKKSLEQEKSVRVEIVPGYNGVSLRPDKITVRQWIDGIPQDPINFRNVRGAGLR